MMLSAMGLKFPNQRFFVPKPRFWDELQLIARGRKIIEFGSGNGDLVREARDRGIDMSGFDCISRDAQGDDVYLLDASMVPLVRDAVVLICRPDHGGWAYTEIVRWKENGNSVIYVGLFKNMERDLEELVHTWDSVNENVGEDREWMVVWNRG